MTSWDTPSRRSQSTPEQVEGVYIISVAARILEMHPQTLRKYERAGLVTPSRTGGMLRLYSEEDIARLRLIKHLVGDLGLNLAGVQLVLEAFNRLLAMRSKTSSVSDGDLRGFLAESLDELFELLHAHRS
jgi:MerR family transcriptional regulator/heat shock protein HspR